ncbi:DUF1127 domain-containing protein [Cognatishimia sp. 1_MG-2023]|uniref:DUF1127 domain-containing protein n=1 Tax=Cognatishimia sp. 1_MG-2023 TaxID=3062642 RepID=UPI0026E353E4|nr:DUF1127 domain-containing protein [Cognatishimia sp. 1_MG-2023]MDO6727756.1 DUF1127 domain-containing protein [Cognatishimia sp. 1_MG-2023]
MATVLNTNYAHVTLADRIRGLFTEFKAALALRAKYNATCNELNNLSQRELEDLGISRWAIKDLARENVYGK